ncbi:hypothetical protein KUTeg_007942, partial [Tegillarca granosa]
MESIHMQRRQTMIEACTGKEKEYVGNNSAKIVGDHIVVDRNHKIVYCGIEKVGSSFWRRIFQLFSPNPMYWSLIGKYIMRTIRKNASRISLECGHDVTFAEFIKYFIRSQLTNKNRDGHFIPMYDHCRPCRIHYDYIGKMENFKKDSLYILDILGFRHLKNSLSHFDNQSLHDTISDQVDNLFGYSGGYKNCISFHDAFRRLWVKFQIRGILSPNIKFSFTEMQTKSLSRKKLKSILTEIIFKQNDRETLRLTKEKAMLDSYNTVDYTDLELLSIILQPDCEIFGYD